MASISAMEMIVTATGDGSSIQFIQTGTEIISFQKMNRKTVPSAEKPVFHSSVDHYTSEMRFWLHCLSEMLYPAVPDGNL